MRDLGADLITVAYSGKGMYRNSSDGGTGGDDLPPMPALYLRTLPSDTTPTWDFNKWTPHVVVVDVGPNDFDKGDPGAPFDDAYVGLLKAVRKDYPEARIYAALGPSFTTTFFRKEMKKHLDAIVARVKDPKTTYFEFAAPLAADGDACEYHPSKTTHAKMAATLAARLKADLGW